MRGALVQSLAQHQGGRLILHKPVARRCRVRGVAGPRSEQPPSLRDDYGSVGDFQPLKMPAHFGRNGRRVYILQFVRCCETMPRGHKHVVN